MGYKTPDETSSAAAAIGEKKTQISLANLAVGGFLAGAYIAFGGMLAITVSSGMDPKIWGTLPTLFTGAVFSVGLILVVLAGSELVTGNMALVPIAALRRRVTPSRLVVNLVLVTIFNFVGAVFVAYFLAIKSGVIGSQGAPAGPQAMTFERLSAIAQLKGVKETDWQIFLRATGANWLVCLAVWLAISAEDVTGKIFGIFFPILAFVAMGFDHVIANMFFLPAAIFAHVPDFGWGDALRNFAFAWLGNLVGAGFFVGTLYWFIHLRGTPDEAAPGRSTLGGAAGTPAEATPARHSAE
jgi:formate transporter